MRKRLTSAAMKMRSQEPNRNVAARLLEHDLLNGPFHCFGYHNHCIPDFCSTARENQLRTDSGHPTDPSSVPSVPSTSSNTTAAEDETSTLDDNSNNVEGDHSRIAMERVWMTPEKRKKPHAGEETPLNVSPQLLHNVQVLVSRLAAKSKQLIGNDTTNLAEAWMHIRCKFDGGKFMN